MVYFVKKNKPLYVSDKKKKLTSYFANNRCFLSSHQLSRKLIIFSRILNKHGANETTLNLVESDSGINQMKLNHPFSCEGLGL